MGLVDPASVKGWKYRDQTMSILEDAVEHYVQLTVGRPYRDRIRTVEKAMTRSRGRVFDGELTRHRRKMDEMCLRFVEELLDVAAVSAASVMSRQVETFLETSKSRFASYVESNRIDEEIASGLAMARMPEDTIDIFRQ